MSNSAKYNMDTEGEVVEWVTKVVEKRKINGGGADELKAHLENGEVLCLLANKLKKKCVSSSILKQKLKKGKNDGYSAFEKIANKQRITAAVQGFVKIGLPESSTFRAEDLAEGKSMESVLMCLYSLGRLCNKKNIKGSNGGIEASGKGSGGL